MALRKKQLVRSAHVAHPQEWPQVIGKPPDSQKAAAVVATESAPIETWEFTPFNAQYLQKLKARDPETAEHFGVYFKKRLEIKVRVRGLQRSDRLDIINETLRRALDAVDRDQVHSPEKFGGYVSGICSNVLSEKRIDMDRHSRHVSLEDIDLRDPAESAERRLLRQERSQLVKRVLNSLPGRDRRLLQMKVFEESSSEEMMAKLGANTPGHLRLLLHRALKAFAKGCKKAGLDSR